MEALTVKQLIEKLQGYNEDLPVTILHDGKGHHHPITSSYWSVDKNPYSPNGSFDELTDEDSVLRIGLF